MKRLIIIISLFLLLGSHGFCQENLILNPSFEDTTLVKNTLCSQAATECSCLYWFSPEYIHHLSINCAVYYAYNFNIYFNNNTFDPDYPMANHIPNSWCGTIFPKDGQAYIGLAFLQGEFVSNPGIQATLETRLRKTLKKDHLYKFVVHYAIQDKLTKPIGSSGYNLGFLFTDSMVERILDESQPYVRFFIYQANPQLKVEIKEPFLLHDWTCYEGTFTAKGGEQFLTIGCFDSLSVYPEKIGLYLDNLSLVDITPEEDLIIPNVFTPNGDGVNDFFEIGNTDDWQVQLQIFNRWGLLVFESETYQKWDGTYQGQRVSEGVYFYVIHANSRRSPVYRDYKGSVTVMYD